MSGSETCELAFIKDGMSGSEKDAGFCSGEDENLHSPSGSEDSVEVQISPISLRNKRKLAEPKKALKSDPNRPLKKRRLIERSSSPFRPWSSPEKGEEDRWRAEEERRREEEAQRLYEAQIHAQVLARLQIASQSQETLPVHSEFRAATSQPDDKICTANSHQDTSLRTPAFLPLKDKIRTTAAHADPQFRTTTLQTDETGFRTSSSTREKIRTAAAHADPQFRPTILRTDDNIHAAIPNQDPSLQTTTTLPSKNEFRTASTQADHQFRTAILHPESNLLTITSQPSINSHFANIRAANSHPEDNYRAATLQNLPHRSISPPTRLQEDSAHQDEPLALVLREGRVPPHPGVTELPYEDKRGGKIPSSRMSSTSGAHSEQSGTGHSQRNYKNMTRERRIEANARERTRVHTISAAFNTLRRSIPAYSHNQKLSKLSVLRIACSYIMTLSKIVREGEGEEENLGAGLEVELGECVDLVSRTIQTEGKLRKKKDD